MTDKPRLIEYAFPLKQTSLDSVHKKNVHEDIVMFNFNKPSLRFFLGHEAYGNLLAKAKGNVLISRKAIQEATLEIGGI